MTDTYLETNHNGHNAPKDPADDPFSALTLFPGDSGTLPAPVRDILVKVMKSRFIDGVRRPDLWRLLLVHEQIVTSRLNDLYLALVLDRDRQVAFTKQVETDDDFPLLLRQEKAMPALMAVLLLHLREEYDRGEAEGTGIVVDHDHLLDHLVVWKKTDDQDASSFRKRSETAITGLREKGILVGIADKRYRISGVIVSLFTAEKVQLLTEAFEEIVTAPEDEPQAADDWPGWETT